MNHATNPAATAERAEIDAFCKHFDTESIACDRWEGWIARATQASAAPVKDHVIREVVNSLRDIAIEFHATGQLRERLSRAITPLLAPTPATLSAKPVQNEYLAEMFGPGPARATQASAEPDPRLQDLRMLIERLARALNGANPDSAKPAEALDYLKRVGLTGSPLRAAPDRAPSIDSAGVAKDAARYRWLRNPVNTEGPSYVAVYGETQLDEQIDAAIAAMQPQGAGGGDE